MLCLSRQSGGVTVVERWWLGVPCGEKGLAKVEGAWGSVGRSVGSRQVCG